MAALVDINDYRKRLQAPREIIQVSKSYNLQTSGRFYDYWTRTNPAGVGPGAPVVPARTVQGAVAQENAAAEELYLLGGQGAGEPGIYILCDRLSHQGGMDGTITTANLTTNLPTAALTRYTTGDGVMAGISIYSGVGSTATTISCTYTNEAGVGGRVSPPMVFGSASFNASTRFLPLPLMAGDLGIRSIQNSTLLATTGTAGNFGYVLYKPLMMFCIEKPNGTGNFSIVDGAMAGGLPPILDEACLFWLSISVAQQGGTNVGFNGAFSLTAV